MDDGIWVTLPSSSSADVFPNNTLQHYVTRLASPLELDSSYEVALAQIQFPNSFSRNSGIVLRDHEEEARLLLMYYRNKETPEETRFAPTVHNYILPCTRGTKRYDDMHGLMTAINTDIAAFRASIKDEKSPMRDVGNNLPNISYDNTSRTYVVSNDVHQMYFLRLRLGPKLARRFGFHPEQFPNIPEEEQEIVRTNFPVRDTTNTPIQSVYVYSDILQPQHVGHTRVPLLRISPVKGESGDITDIEFRRLHYFPLQKYSIQFIEIDLRDEQGHRLEFADYGRVICVLHLRRRR